MSHKNVKNSEDFQKNPLIVWIQSYLDAPISSNADLSNGILLQKVLNLIDPAVFSVLHIQNGAAHDVTSRAHNLAEILHGIKRFYLEKLQQIVVLKMPDILMLAKEPNNELSHNEMNTILLLILGCAIQCDKKQEFIEHIKELEVDIQRGLVASIQQITENPDTVIPYRANELSDMSQDELMTLSESLYIQLQNVLEQRDDYVEAMLDLALVQESGDQIDISEESPRFRPRHPLSPRTSFRSTNILQANRQRLQSIQSELDDRSAYVGELKEELEQMKLLLDNVRLENKQLVNEAGWAKSYRDELDVLKSQIENTNKIQSENAKLKEKARDLEFYKKKYEEAKTQSEHLYESKLVLEERMAGSNSKISKYSLLEDENSRLYTQVKLLMEERGDDQNRIKDLIDQVAKLSVEKQESLSAYSLMNAELDGLKMQKQDDGLNVPLLIEYNQSNSADVIRLEHENKHLVTLLDQMRTSTPNDRLKELEQDNHRLSENLLDYKNMISKLTKAMLTADGKSIIIKSLLSEKNNNRELTNVIDTQVDSMRNLQGTLTKRNSELEQTATDLNELTKELAQRGVVVDTALLKEALSMEAFSNGDVSNKTTLMHQKLKPNLTLEKQVQETKSENYKLKEDLADKKSEVQMLESKVRQVQTFGKKVEEQLEKREKDIEGLERRFEKTVTENKVLQQNVTLHEDKVAALEERVSHLMSSASEDTRKVNKSLQQKLERISELESRLLHLNENSKDLEKTRELLKLKEEKCTKLQQYSDDIEEKHRMLEIQFEKSKNSCIKLEHCMKLKDERITSLESSVNELTIAANNKQSERIELLMKSLDTRGEDIADLEKKIEDLLKLNNKLKLNNRTKNDQVQILEDRITELERQLGEGNTPKLEDGRVKVLNKQLTEREGQIDELEVKLNETTNLLSKANRSLEHKKERVQVLEQKLQDLEEVSHQKEKLTCQLDDRSKKILALEMQLDNIQNENSKLNKTLTRKEEEYSTTRQNLGTLEASITDQSSLSKLVQLKDKKIGSLNALLDEKDENIVNMENRVSESEGKVKKLTHALKLRDGKLSALEQSVEKLEEYENNNNKLLTMIDVKDSKIRELEDKLDQLNELTRLNQRLKENISSKEEKIATLEQRIDDLDESVKMNERLNQQVKQKEERISSLQERIQYLENQLHKTEQLKDTIKKNAETELMKLSEQNQELSDVKVKRQMSIMRREKKIVNLETRLNQYASERQEKDSRIQDLQEKLENTLGQFRKLGLTNDEKEHQLEEMEDRMEEIRETYRENQKLSKLLQRKEDELMTLQKKFTDLDHNNNQSSDLLGTKDQNIRDLQGRLEETLALNNRLNLSTKKQEEKIKNLEQNLMDNEIRFEKSSSEIETKNRQFERNKERCDQLQQQINEKQSEIIQLDKKLSMLQGVEGERSRLQILLKEKEVSIKNLEQKLEDNSKSSESNESHLKAIREKEEEMEKLVKKINELASEKYKSLLNLQEKDGTIADLERRVEELQLTATDSDKLNMVVKEKNSQISILRESLDEFHSNTAQLETRLDEFKSEQTRTSHAIKQKEERLQVLKNQLEDYINKNHSLTNDLQMREEKMKYLQKSLDEMTERNKDLEEDINMLEKDLEELKKTGSLKNITNITEKIQLTKRARTELHIQRGPPRLSSHTQKIEIKMSPNKQDETTNEIAENLEKLQEQNELLEKQKSRLTNQMENLSLQNASLLTKNETLQSDYDLLRKDYEAVRKEMNEAREHFQELDVSATKIAHRCEVLVQLNATLEEENKALMEQVNKLLAQNQELLVTTLSSRDQYMDEERTFTDHIYELEREKEKLSEKVMAAERALMDSGGKRKGALWRGTRKILKRAGLTKKKTDQAPTSISPDDELFSDNSTSPTTTPVHIPYTDSYQSPLGPIRSLLSRSRQDVSRLDDSVTRKASNTLDYSTSSASEVSSKYKSRPKSEFYPISRSEYKTPTSEQRRRRSMEHVGDNDQEDGCEIIPLNEQITMPSDHGSVVSAQSSGSNTPTTTRKLVGSCGASTPIQKVRVTQMTTPKVMKASPEAVRSIIARQPLDESPRSSRKQIRASTFASTPLSHEKNSSVVARSESLTDSVPFDRRHSLRISRRKSEHNKSQDSTDSGPLSQRSSEVGRRAVSRSESFSPPASSNPFGAREQRSSFRRYEFEQMERRPLPETRGSDSDSESQSNQFPRVAPALDRLVETFTNREQRDSIRRIHRSSSNASTKQDDRTDVAEPEKKPPQWYEYGNV